MAGVNLSELLKKMIEMGGSDLHITTNSAPRVRVHGHLRPLDMPPLTAADTKSLAYSVLTDVQKHRLEENLELDFSFGLKSLARFRGNIFHQRGAVAAVFRTIPWEIKSFDALGLPPVVRGLCDKPRGLVLVTGPTGSGKSTTLAALIDDINRREARHIVTIEDPIEYEHTHIRSVIEQVEIGTDAPDFPTALRAALRQAPDVLVVGEMRDPETMRIAVAAAETGHLVLSTLHTIDVATTISRISDSFSDERQNTIRQELAMALTAVLTQILLPSKTGERFPAAELLMIGYGARQHIRRNALQHLHQEITMTKKKGSFALEESLVQLISKGHIDREDALLCAIHPDDLDILLKTGSRG